MGFIFSKFSKLGSGAKPYPLRKTNFSNPPTPFGLATPLRILLHLLVVCIHLHHCDSSAVSFSHIKSCWLLQQHFLRCHKHCWDDFNLSSTRLPGWSRTRGSSTISLLCWGTNSTGFWFVSGSNSWSRSSSTTPSVVEVRLPQPHLQFCPGGRRQGSSAVCCAGRPGCALNQDLSLRA